MEYNALNGLSNDTINGFSGSEYRIKKTGVIIGPFIVLSYFEVLGNRP